MRRGLLDRRYRLLQQHHQHEETVKWYRERQEDVKVVGSGLWKVTEGGAVHNVQQVDCTCDSTANLFQLDNHCTKGDCGACGYGFQCDCEQDVQSRISCLHVYAN
ncbi:hypothetical protein GCK32_011420 [Trichostrongylus colubriformis]|uniref:Uncharacterized protein n=1 Tax=Trichostrongylus colubriformis TaxID=6319 RepID=A0AAN8IJS9_TRICO